MTHRGLRHQSGFCRFIVLCYFWAHEEEGKAVSQRLTRPEELKHAQKDVEAYKRSAAADGCRRNNSFARAGQYPMMVTDFDMRADLRLMPLGWAHVVIPPAEKGES